MAHDRRFAVAIMFAVALVVSGACTSEGAQPSPSEVEPVGLVGAAVPLALRGDGLQSLGFEVWSGGALRGAGLAGLNEAVSAATAVSTEVKPCVLAWCGENETVRVSVWAETIGGVLNEVVPGVCGGLLPACEDSPLIVGFAVERVNMLGRTTCTKLPLDLEIRFPGRTRVAFESIRFTGNKWNANFPQSIRGTVSLPTDEARIQSTVAASVVDCPTDPEATPGFAPIVDPPLGIRISSLADSAEIVEDVYQLYFDALPHSIDATIDASVTETIEPAGEKARLLKTEIDMRKAHVKLDRRIGTDVRLFAGEQELCLSVPYSPEGLAKCSPGEFALRLNPAPDEATVDGLLVSAATLEADLGYGDDHRWTKASQALSLKGTLTMPGARSMPLDLQITDESGLRVDATAARLADEFTVDLQYARREPFNYNSRFDFDCPYLGHPVLADECPEFDRQGDPQFLPEETWARGHLTTEGGRVETLRVQGSTATGRRLEDGLPDWSVELDRVPSDVDFCFYSGTEALYGPQGTPIRQAGASCQFSDDMRHLAQTEVRLLASEPVELKLVAGLLVDAIYNFDDGTYRVDNVPGVRKFHIGSLKAQYLEFAMHKGGGETGPYWFWVNTTGGREGQPGYIRTPVSLTDLVIRKDQDPGARLDIDIANLETSNSDPLRRGLMRSGVELGALRDSLNPAYGEASCDESEIDLERADAFEEWVIDELENTICIER